MILENVVFMKQWVIKYSCTVQISLLDNWTGSSTHCQGFIPQGFSGSFLEVLSLVFLANFLIAAVNVLD